MTWFMEGSVNYGRSRGGAQGGVGQGTYGVFRHEGTPAKNESEKKNIVREGRSGMRGGWGRSVCAGSETEGKE